jgi:hypothetical protein
MMKRAKATLALIVVLAGILASEPVLARGHGGAHSGGHSHGHRASHHRVIVSSAIFLPPYNYYPPYYYVQPAPWGYIEQGSDFYYCAETQKNFPDAQDCPGGWQLITPPPTPGY